MITSSRAAVASTGIEYFGLKVCLLVPEHLNIKPKEAAEGFTQQINNLIERANHPSPRELCEMAAKMQLGMFLN